jgi:hypothetical protein
MIGPSRRGFFFMATATKSPPEVNLLRRIRSEYAEMPGLRLTPAQAGRLWALEPRACENLLGRLVDEGYLAKTRDGAYLRTSVA